MAQQILPFRNASPDSLNCASALSLLSSFPFLNRAFIGNSSNHELKQNFRNEKPEIIDYSDNNGTSRAHSSSFDTTSEEDSSDVTPTVKESKYLDATIPSAYTNSSNYYDVHKNESLRGGNKSAFTITADDSQFSNNWLFPVVNMYTNTRNSPNMTIKSSAS